MSTAARGTARASPYHTASVVQWNPLHRLTLNTAARTTAKVPGRKECSTSSTSSSQHSLHGRKRTYSALGLESLQRLAELLLDLLTRVAAARRRGAVTLGARIPCVRRWRRCGGQGPARVRLEVVRARTLGGRPLLFILRRRRLWRTLLPRALVSTPVVPAWGGARAREPAPHERGPRPYNPHRSTLAVPPAPPPRAAPQGASHVACAEDRRGGVGRRRHPAPTRDAAASQGPAVGGQSVTGAESGGGWALRAARARVRGSYRRQTIAQSTWRAESAYPGWGARIARRAEPGAWPRPRSWSA
eukprot:scaffold7401_cov296-Prasinococcus_capsulatus_cf.AAC.2